MKTIIFTQRVEEVKSYQERRDCADQRIGAMLWACGYLAVPVPNSPDSLEEAFHKISPEGILLTGGNSLVRYGGDAPERDQTDYKLIQLAEKQRLPLMGFCRGMQSILDYYGNQLENVDGHVATRHRIHGEIGTFEVNSYHNQACKRLKEGGELKSLAESEDGVIEAVCHKSLPIVGIMWHLEREAVLAEHDFNNIKRLFQ